MHLDVLELKAFYERTMLGRATKTALQSVMREMWPDVAGQTVVGFGYAVPVLRPFLAEAGRVVSLMPGQQGVAPWPRGAFNVSTLVEETSWPITAGTVDRLAVVHGLDTCERPDALLAEINRVLAPGGSVAFILPNRAGVWARRDLTPFGYGRPYSLRQAETQMRRHKLIPERHRHALYAPPSEARFWLRTWPAWEKIGRKIGAPVLSGAIILEATKQVFIMPKGGAAEAIKKPLEVLEGLANPKPKAASGRVARRSAK